MTGPLRTIVFMNADAKPRNRTIVCDTSSIAPIMAWYGSHHAGDRYTVAVDGRNMPMDQNGKPIGSLIGAAKGGQ